MRQFPDDEKGDVLRQMQESGDDLSKPRQIDFSVVLPDESRANKLATHFQTHGYSARVNCSKVVNELPWDVTVSTFMLPVHDAITQFEEMLDAVAAPLGGRNDGWGCFERGKDH